MLLDTILVVRDDGLGDGNPSFLLDGSPGAGGWLIRHEGLDGFDGVDIDISTQDYAQYDGARLTGERAAAADRTISGIGIGVPGELRSQAERFFVPGRDYEVHVSSAGRRRFARARHMGLRLATDNATGHQLLEWTFLAPDPYWLDEDARGYDVAEAQGRFGFPFMSLAAPYVLEAQGDEGEAGPGPAGAEPESEEVIDYLAAGFVAGVLSHRIEMSNEGSATAYPAFAIEATGEVKNPRIAVYGAGGEAVCTFGVAVTMQDGDELVIDFSARPTSIALNGRNVSNMATAGSTLATGIEPGDFTLEWDADSGDAAMSVRPTIRDRFVTI